MGDKSGRAKSWHLVLSATYIILGILIGIGMQVEVIDMLDPAPLVSYVILALIASLITWSFTYYWLMHRSIDNQKEIARKAVRRTFEHLKTASRTLDNIDIKTNAITASHAGHTIERALAHEYLMGVRAQVVELYNDISTSIDDWRDILADEFEEIETKEREIDKLIIDQIRKTRLLNNLERKPDATMKELAYARSELDRLAEKQRSMRSEILFKSKKLIGAPITTVTDVAYGLSTIGTFEPLVKQPVYLSEKERAK